MVGFRKKKGSVGTTLFSSFAWSAKLRPILERERERESLSGKMRHGDVRYNFTACRAEGIELAHDRLVRESCTRILLHLVSEGSCVLAADVIWQG